ncbi:MAG: transposase [Methylotetracoccus sp.]|nr:transposase [Methylotetracoccus sp.]
MQAWEHGRGFSVNAEVWVPSWDRAGLERLIRYCARPLGERLAWLEPEQRLVYRVPEPRLGGQTALGLTPISLVDEAPPQAHPLTMWSTDPIEFLVRLSVADRHGVTSCHRSCADVKFPHLGCQLSNG